MTTRSLVIVLLVVLGQVVIVKQAEAGAIIKAISGIFEFSEDFLGLVVTNFQDVIREIFDHPENRNSSIQYLLFTPEQPGRACYMEPNQETLERCRFNATRPMKFLIHGFHAILDNSSLFWPMKDRLIELYDYNVIVVNWTSYNQLPYLLACLNTIAVGNKVAEFIQFLQKNSEIEAKDIHLIGHSLGAHLAGVVGRKISNLRRITGLDPAGPLYAPNAVFPALRYGDADFVDVMHTSNLTTGFGNPAPIGDIDFYPNGGQEQPQCQTLGVNFTGPEAFFTGSCNHRASLYYFIQSINTTECIFLSTLCNGYANFLDGRCANKSLPMAKMGLPARPISGLGPKSTFYLQTLVHEPYCSQDGYEPIDFSSE